MATQDEDGYFRVMGRADDVMNVSGYRIGTAEVESALVSHPAVAEAAVIGRPDPIKGESIKAFVILRQGFEASDDLLKALKQHVREELSPIAIPGDIEFVPSLAQNAQRQNHAPRFESQRTRRRTGRYFDVGRLIYSPQRRGGAEQKTRRQERQFFSLNNLFFFAP